MHDRNLYPNSCDPTYADLDAFLATLAGDTPPYQPDQYRSAYELCEQFVGLPLVSAAVVIEYPATQYVQHFLRSFRNYPFGAVTSLVDADGNAVTYTQSSRRLSVRVAIGTVLTLTYADVVPTVVMQAIRRQAGVFHGRIDYEPPEYGGLDLSGTIRHAQDPRFLGGLASDVRAMLSPYRRLSF